MSYKPCRSSGVMLDKYKKQSERYTQMLDDVLKNANPPKFKQLNAISRYAFFIASAERNFMNELNGKKTEIRKQDIETVLPPYFLKVLLNNKDYAYKPFLKLMSE